MEQLPPTSTPLLITSLLKVVQEDEPKGGISVPQDIPTGNELPGLFLLGLADGLYLFHILILFHISSS